MKQFEDRIAKLEARVSALERTHQRTSVDVKVEQPPYLVNPQTVNDRLKKAAHDGDFDAVKQLVEQGADVNNSNGYPISIASACGHLSIVEYLADNHADIHAFDDTPLRIAAPSGHLSVVKFLVKRGANIRVFGCRAVIDAFNRGHMDVFKCLVNAAKFTPEEIRVLSQQEPKLASYWSSNRVM